VGFGFLFVKPVVVKKGPRTKFCLISTTPPKEKPQKENEKLSTDTLHMPCAERKAASFEAEDAPFLTLLFAPPLQEALTGGMNAARRTAGKFMEDDPNYVVCPESEVWTFPP